MLLNYLKIAYRNLLRQKGFSLINIVGLTVGLTCCFLILLFVRHELSYDTFQQKYDRIYRVTYLPKFAGLEQPLALTPPPAAPLLPANFSEIETSARLVRYSATIEVADARPDQHVKYDEERFFFGDSTLLDIFTFHFRQGNPHTALKDKFTVVITDDIATKYFGKENPLGKTLLYEGKHPLRVTGVVDKFPDNSHVHIDLLSNYETMYATESEAVRQNLAQNWVISHGYTYVLLRPGKSAETVNARFPQFLLTHATKQYAKDIVYALEPLRDIHLRSNAQNTPEPAGSMTYLYVFIGIALMTLLIACINFVNLSTARSLKRAKEVGIRKVLGSEKQQLIAQFIGESMLLSVVALFFSLILISVLLPVLNNLTGKSLTLSYLLSDGWLLVLFVGVALLTGLLSGSYPAFFVSNFQPIATLKGSFVSGKAKGGAVRQVLLGVQFVASIALIIGTLVAFQQLDYMQNRPLGFDKTFMITANTRNDKITNVFANRNDSTYLRLRTFREILLSNPHIQQVTLANRQMGDGAIRRNVVPEGHKPDDNLFIGTVAVDHNFAQTYGLKFVAGRDFSEAYPTDKTAAFLINETGVKQFGWKSPTEAIGKSINLEGKDGKIVGVLKDFHNQSLLDPIEGLLVSVDQPRLSLFSIKIQAQDKAETLKFIQQEWDKYFPEKGFSYQFLDERLAQLYEREQRLSKLIGYFAGLAILLSCLGLYGLVSLVTQQKTKEIGIRKVLGASVSSIVSLLSKDFVILVLVALVIASPLAWWAMNKWLAGFTYKIDIEWWMFALAGVLTVLVALLTVSFQSIKAALMNPVKSLRSE
ncbi:FtsX-like permease family protein [Spirosoma sp. HMF4905]|uniref:FtsX-like permease family protein n=1 Tax=Spirosoma arboris TaxID=2682092 RepID=A0A7K1SAD5_9BACT|nr:ABC transporter permease [Spirosoma arboris]MVM30784.1 FtsX-like permease family protein [Spirosoma arboris]